MSELPAHGFWHADREDTPHEPPDGMDPEMAVIFTALQMALLAERAESGAYVSFLDSPTVSLDGRFEIDRMASFIAAVVRGPN